MSAHSPDWPVLAALRRKRAPRARPTIDAEVGLVTAAEAEMSDVLAPLDMVLAAGLACAWRGLCHCGVGGGEPKEQLATGQGPALA